MNDNPIKIEGSKLTRALKFSILDGVFAQILGTLTGGVFLVDYALKMGATNFIIGLIATIPFLAQLIQIAGVYLIERFKLRKPLTIRTALLHRVLWLFMAAIPFLFKGPARLTVFLITFIIINLSAALTGGAWTSWMRDLVPKEMRGKFFSRRMAITLGISIPLGLFAAYYIDKFNLINSQGSIVAYSILFAVGFLAGMVSLFFLARVPEPRMVSTGSPDKLFEMLKEPLKNENFRNLIIFLSSWSFAVNLAAPFFTVYMLKRLNLSMSLIIGFSILSQVFNVIFLPIWGKYSDRFGNKPILQVCAPMFFFAILAWIFLTMPEGKYFMTYPLLIMIHIFTGIATAGISLAAGNMSLNLAPKGQATAYLTTNSIINSIFSGIAPFIGGYFADLLATKQLTMSFTWTTPMKTVIIPTLNLQQWDFFFLISFVLGLYSLHRLSLVKERGESEDSDKVLVQSMMKQLRKNISSLSTAAGLLDLVLLPYNVIRKTYRSLK